MGGKMNIKLYTYHGAPDLWLDYSEWDGEFYINSIYSGSDPKRLDITDFVSDSVMARAMSRMVEDYHERV
jgi:hypothetical protein